MITYWNAIKFQNDLLFVNCAEGALHVHVQNTLCGRWYLNWLCILVEIRYIKTEHLNRPDKYIS